MLDNDNQRRKLIDKGGKMKRLIATFGIGLERKDQKKEEISFLGKHKGNSSMNQEEAVKKHIERIKANVNLNLDLNFKIDSYETENGDLRNIELGLKIEHLNEKEDKLVHQRFNDTLGGTNQERQRISIGHKTWRG